MTEDITDDNSEESQKVTTPAAAWIRRYCSVAASLGVSRPFQPYKYQFALWNDPSRQRIVLKSRQMGVSHALACEAVYIALNEPGSTILFVSRGLGAARNLLRYASRSIAPAIRSGKLPRPTTQNHTTLEWDDIDSRVVSLAASPDAARSYSATAVYLDEAAYLPFAEEIYQSLAPTVSQNGRMTVVSTPHGRGNLFHRLWEEGGIEHPITEEAESQVLACTSPLQTHTPTHLHTGSAWSLHRVHWSERPEYTDEWAARERRRHTARSWAEEYELSFEDSGNCVFSEKHIRELQRGGLTPPQPPFYGGLDFARSADFTVLAVLDSTGQLVALERFNTVGWTVQVDRVVQAMKSFPGCRVVCDASGLGDPVIAMMQSQMALQPSPRFQVVPFFYTAESRTVLMEALILAVETKKIRIPGSGGSWLDRWKGRGNASEADSEPPETTGPDPAAVQALLAELRTFQWEETAGGKPVPRHPSGGHDDCIQALAMAWKAGGEVRNHVPRAMPALTMVGKTPIAIHRSSFRHPYDDDDPGWWIPEGAVVPYDW